MILKYYRIKQNLDVAKKNITFSINAHKKYAMM